MSENHSKISILRIGKNLPNETEDREEKQIVVLWRPTEECARK